MNIKFCGAAKAVTGSCHLVECSHGRFLVDCGMRQGEDKNNEYGEDSFPFDPKTINAVLLTHAHIDHSGLLPLLVKQGFNGSILATKATARLCTVMLPDSAKIQESDAKAENRRRIRSGKPEIEPLYTLQDANKALSMFSSVDYDVTAQLMDGVVVCFKDSGHLLGSSSIEVWIKEADRTVKLLFSGDIGRKDRPIIRDPEYVDQADYVIMESTYGDRDHSLFSAEAKRQQFADCLKSAIARGGNIIIPSFAVGRTQELLYYIKSFLDDNSVPGLESIPVYVDSPLAIEATRIYERSVAGFFDEDAQELSAGGSAFDFPTLHISQSTDDSKLINVTPGQKIIISSSGMCEAGRIRHHLKHNLYNNNVTVLFPGYQAVGTLGRMLVDGAKTVRMFGETITVRANIEQLTEFSGHAGKSELIEWISALKTKPECVFLVHGEDEALNSLEKALSSLGFNVTIPALASTYELGRSEIKNVSVQTPELGIPNIRATRRDAVISEQLTNIAELIESVKDRHSPDIELKIELMSDELKAFVERWEKTLTK